MTLNYERIIRIAVEEGVHQGLHSLENTDIENLKEDELISVLTEHIMTEFGRWIDLTHPASK
jgi:hypothetical protein|tara:strand:+ start:128 stop:313 length:186 start_codon:yes stop_codon:yes gene_type:complete